VTIELDINETFTRLRKFKRRLWSLSLGAVLIILIQMALVAVSAVILRTSAVSASIVKTSKELQEFFILSLSMSFILVVIVLIFERTVRSARIFSGELADAIGLYRSSPSSSNASAVSTDVSSTSDSDYIVGEDKMMQARLLLRNIAKRSSLPLSSSESELSSLWYIIISLIMLIAHALNVYASLVK
jgi:hypothetical protein